MDANILVAGFLRSATTRQLLLDERLVLWAPEYSLTETERVLTSPRLRRRLGGLAHTEVRSVLAQLTTRVRVLPASAYHRYLSTAQQLAPHPEDAPYLALALHLNLPLWSNDAPLTRQHAVRVYSTEDLLALLAA